MVVITGGTQPSSYNQRNYAHRHQSHAAWGAGGNGARAGNRGARGREGVVVVQNITDKYNVRRFINVCFKSY